MVDVVESRRRHSPASAPFPPHVRATLGLRLGGLATSIPVGVNSIRWMQSTRPSHHANASRSLFQNPWTLADLTPSASNYLPAFPRIPTALNLSTLLTKLLTIPNLPLERVRNSGSHPHPPIQVVKPDWGHSTRAAASSDPNLKATWLGHAVSRIAGPL